MFAQRCSRFGRNGLSSFQKVHYSRSTAKLIDDDYLNRPGAWDDRTLNSLLDANKAWKNRMIVEKPDFFSELKKGHAPKILWIGCSDARVPANEIIGEPPGSVFIHRNVANMVVNTDFNCMSVVQYAVDVLKVKHIIVCGHYDCGGIRAALEQWDHKSPLENWLRNIRDTYRLHMEELNGIKDARSRQRRLVELNVIEQCVNIFKTSVVQRRRVDTHLEIGKPGSKVHFSEPRVHAMVYEPTTGELTKLPVDFNEYFKVLRQVYDLYSLNDDDKTSTAEAKANSAAVKATAAAQSAASVAGQSPSFTKYPISDANDEEEVAIQAMIDSYPLHSKGLPFNPLEVQGLPYNPDDY